LPGQTLSLITKVRKARTKKSLITFGPTLTWQLNYLWPLKPAI